MNEFAKNWDELSEADLFARASAKWSKVDTDGTPLAGAWVAESDFGPAPVVIEAVNEALLANRTGYLPPYLGGDLANACARFQADRFGWQIDPRQIIAAPDVLSILKLMIETLTEPGAGIIVPTPAYMPFLSIPPALNRRAIQVPSAIIDGRWTLDYAGIEAAAAAGAKLLILCNPWNPTGRALADSELLELGKIVEKYQLWVFSDEIHAPLVLPGNTHLSFARLLPHLAHLTVTAVAASKAFNIAGLRSATAIITDPALDQRLAPGFEKLQNALVPLGMETAIACYDRGREWLDAQLEYIAANARHTVERVKASGFEITMPEATYLTWWNTRRSDGAQRLATEAKIAVNAGLTLGDDWSTWVRFNIGTGRKALDQMLDRALAALTPDQS